MIPCNFKLASFFEIKKAIKKIIFKVEDLIQPWNLHILRVLGRLYSLVVVIPVQGVPIIMGIM